MEPLRFYFDFISPYAYVAWARIHEVAARHDREVRAIPVLFAAMLDENGQKGPAEIPAKRVYTFKDAYRKAHRAGLPPLTPPPSHPFNPLLALRAASLEMDEGDRRALVDALYAQTWRDGVGIEGPSLVAAAAKTAGLDGQALVAAAGEPPAKERLRRATADAIANGVFGVPTVIADGELFWGVDSLDLLETFLLGQDPVPRDAALHDRPATAVRRGIRGDGA